ncbi:MAG TPA: aminomethyl-transferring glycine dehydrogenase subunit GcvPA [Nitrospiria bacterium]
MEFISNTKREQQEMLDFLGAKTTEDLIRGIPSEVRLTRGLRLPPPLTELEVKKEFGRLSRKNADLETHPSFLGAGAYDHYIPSVVNHIIGRSEFYSSYTPYQAEMSQGFLQTIYEFQTMVSELAGMDVANASLYDGGSSMAEAALMSIRVTRRKKILVSSLVHPDYRKILRTYLSGSLIRIVEIPGDEGRTDLSRLRRELSEDVACVLLQSPNFFGCLESLEEISGDIKRSGALFVVSTDPMSLGLIEAPGKLGADVVVGEGQGMGNALNFGGPYLGLFATRKEYVRQMPGRIVGATMDMKGKKGFCLTLQTREQHIKRERATSNICTNEALAALASTVYLSLMGPAGLKEVGRLCLQKANYLMGKISGIKGFKRAFPGPFFKEFVVRTPLPPSRLNKKLYKKGLIGGYDLGKVDSGLKNHWMLCVTEKRTKEEMDTLIRTVREAV